jgi:hypothetical protein
MVLAMPEGAGEGIPLFVPPAVSHPIRRRFCFLGGVVRARLQGDGHRVDFLSSKKRKLMVCRSER